MSAVFIVSAYRPLDRSGLRFCARDDADRFREQLRQLCDKVRFDTNGTEPAITVTEAQAALLQGQRAEDQLDSRRGIPRPPAAYGSAGRIRIGEETDSVLLVDDVPGFRTKLRKLLDELPCRVIIADTAAEALQVLNHEVVHCVVCDVHSGTDAALHMVRNCKANPRLKHVPFVVLRSGSCRDLLLECLDAGADHCVVKTEGRLAEITARIRNVIANRNRVLDSLRGRGGFVPVELSGQRWSIDTSRLSRSDCTLLARIEEIVESRYSSPAFDVERLADVLKVDRRKLERSCERLLGVTPSELIRTVRLIHAWFHLKAGKAVKAVRSLVGYPPHGDFKDHFTSCFGITPLEMKRIVSGIY